MNAITPPPLTGEIIGPSETVTVVAAMHPLKSDHRILLMPAGSSVTEIIEDAAAQCGVSRLAKSAHVTINGHVIPTGNWSRVRVKAGAHVVVRAVPGKGIGNILKSILMIALAVIAPWAGGIIAGAIGLGGSALAATMVSGAIMLGGSLLLNALFPPTPLKSADNPDPSYSIAAQKNAAAKWGAIPVMLGNGRTRPKYAAIPYTEFVGDDQYLRMLFVWGYGPMKISDLKIGETSADEYDDIEVQTFEGYPDDGHQTLYPSQVVQDDMDLDITKEDGPFVRSSAEDATEIVIDLVAPQGLVDVDTQSGDKDSFSVSITVEMRPTGSADAWTNKGTVTLKGKSNDPIRKSFRYPDLGGGQWDIRLTRLTDDYDPDKGAHGPGNGGVYAYVHLTAVKTFRTAPPIDFRKPLAITALRIRATKQLNGTIDDLNAICSTVAKSWDGAAWVDGQETRNPGDLMRLVLQGPANARPQPDARLDLPTIEAFADRCRAAGFSFDMYRDFTASVRDTLKDICAAGRGVPMFRDGKWSVAWEDDAAPIVQHFTPRNSRDFTWTQSYRVFPHGLRCKFVNRNKDFVEDEILVFDDGFDKTNATLYEQAEFPGVTEPALIYKHAKYRIADARERPAVYTMTVDFEHLIAQRADRVVVGHDIIMQGLASGRIKAVAGQQLTLDEPAVMEAGKAYGIRIRRRDGSSVVRSVVNAPGAQTVVTIVGTVPEAGDLYTFGISGQETGTYRILAIRPGEELSAEIDLVDDGQNVQGSDADTDIPGGSTQQPGGLINYRPRNLRIVQTTVSSAGAATRIVRLYWEQPFGLDVQSFEALAVDEDGIEVRVTVPANQFFATFENLADGNWSFRVRALLPGGRATPFADPILVVVSPANLPMPFVTGLGLVGGTTATEYTGTDPEFAWVNNWPGYQALPSGRQPLFSRNVVKIYDVASNDLLRTDYTEVPAYTYGLALNRADNSKLGRGASRNIRIEVAVEDIWGRTSDFVPLTVNNPPPAAIAPEVTASFDQLFISWALPLAPDLAGVAVWLSPTAGFDPMATVPVYDGLNTIAVVPASSNQPYYLRIGAYDTFGRDAMNISGELEVQSLSAEIDTDPPAVPALDPLTATTDQLTATWSAATEADFAYYDVQIKAGTGNYVSFQTSTNTYQWPVVAGITYTVRVFAVDGVGNKSAASNTRQKTVTGDTTAPAVPVWDTVSGGFEAFWLKWHPVADADLSHYEVYQADAATPAPVLATAATYTSASETLVLTGQPLVVTRHFWVRAVDFSGNKSAWSVRVQATTASIGPSDIADDAVYARHLVLSDTTNLVPDNLLRDPSVWQLNGWEFYAVGAFDTAPNAVRYPYVAGQTGYSQPLCSAQFPVNAGQQYFTSCQTHRYDSAGHILFRVHFFDVNGASLDSTGYTSIYSGDPGSVQTISGTFTPIAGAKTAQLRWYTLRDNNTGDVGVGTPVVRAMNAGELIVDGAVKAHHLAAEELITLAAQIRDAIITSAKILDLDAAKLRAGTALAGSLTVAGNPIATIAGNAMDPAAQINRGTTQILPGKILVQGAQTLLDVLGSWAYGGDYAAIDGGAIAADSLQANSAVFGLRGLRIEGLQFEHNSPAFNKVSWTAGTIRYIGDDGNIITASVPAGNATWASATLYLTFQQGSAAIVATTNLTTAMAPDRVTLAAYKGDTDLVTDYGRTVIDGGHIKAIMAAFQQADIDSLRTQILIAEAVKTAMLDAGAVTAEKLAIGSGKNLFSNASFASGMDGWTWAAPGETETNWGGYYVSIRPPGTSWAGNTFGTLQVGQPNGYSSATSYVDVMCRPVGIASTNMAIPCAPGDFHELSAYVSTHRCEARLYIQYYDATGAFISTASSVSIPASASDANNPDLWPRYVTRATAPANAAFVRVLLRKLATTAGQANSFMFVNKPQLCLTVPNATEITPWSDGSLTRITEFGLETGAVKARHIGAKEVTADKMDVTDLSAISANLGSIEVDTANIKDLSVDTIKVKDGAITKTYVTRVELFSGGSGWRSAAALAVNAAAGETVLLTVTFFMSKSPLIGTAGLRLLKDGAVFQDSFNSISTGGGSSYTFTMVADNFVTAQNGTSTYTLQCYNSQTTTNLTMGSISLVGNVFRR